MDNAHDDTLLDSPIESKLDAILAEIQKGNKPAEKPKGDTRLDLCASALAATIQPIQFHTRAKIKSIVLSISAVDSVDVSIGAQTWRFYDLGVGTNNIPFPETLERGVDVLVRAVTGTTLLTAYLIVEDVE